jgi:hypothetical protein
MSVFRVFVPPHHIFDLENGAQAGVQIGTVFARRTARDDLRLVLVQQPQNADALAMVICELVASVYWLYVCICSCDNLNKPSTTNHQTLLLKFNPDR